MRYFDIEDFDSPDRPGSGAKMKPFFLNMLDETRHKAGIPFIVSSGYRTRAHNKHVGGVNGSSHTKGVAADIKCRRSSDRFKIIAAALEVGITRIGVSGKFIHLDCDESKAQNVIWTY